MSKHVPILHLRSGLIRNGVAFTECGKAVSADWQPSDTKGARRCEVCTQILDRQFSQRGVYER